MFALCGFALLSAAHASAANDRASWAVVTGASSGIGAAAARQAAARGFNVLLAARRPEQLRAAAPVDILPRSPTLGHTLPRQPRPGNAWGWIRALARLGPFDLACMACLPAAVSSAMAHLVDPVLSRLIPPLSMLAGGGRRDSRLQLRCARRDRAVRPGARDRRRHALCRRHETRRHFGGAQRRLFRTCSCYLLLTTYCLPVASGAQRLRLTTYHSLLTTYHLPLTLTTH